MITTPLHSFYEHDYRYDSQYCTIEALDKLIEALHNRINDSNWYDGLWFMEDAEMVYGLGYISIQNYIHKSIKDYCYSSNIQYDNKFYLKTGKRIEGFSHTNIELINALANFAKHEHDKIKIPTSEVLLAFGLRAKGEFEQDDDFEIERSPIYTGLKLISENGKLLPILLDIKMWRDSLWKNEIIPHQSARRIKKT